jgi:16S rRNA (cytosine967-C5)-methyltransferase
MRAPLSTELKVAADIVSLFEAGQDLDVSMAAELAKAQNVLDTHAVISLPAVKEFVYRVVRQLRTLNALASLLNSKPPPPWLGAMQKVVLAQLIQTDLISMASQAGARARLVDQAIEAVKANKTHAFAAGFLNATLRRFLRESDPLLRQARIAPDAQFNYPVWWLTELQKDYPQNWRAIAEAGSDDAPFTVRVNRRLMETADYLNGVNAGLAADAHLEARPVRTIPCSSAVVFKQARPIASLDGFAAGMVSVQDAGAQLAAVALDLADGHHVLDACAAPGGKTVHCLEIADVSMVALDSSSDRLARVAENLSRFRAGQSLVSGGLSSACLLKVGDARVPSEWWDGKHFDRILADVPCSASGIVRRHPDIRWRRQRGDLATFSKLQLEILNGLWPLLKPGGKLLYVTCSVFWQEGTGVIERFLEGRRNVVIEPLFHETAHPNAASFLSTPLGTYVLPMRSYRSSLFRQPDANEQGMASEHDGFFYARLVKSM